MTSPPLPDFVFGSVTCCGYCGDPANARDHIVPVSFTFSRGRQKDRKKMPEGGGPVMRCCSRCNGYLGSRFFPTFLERVQFMNEKLKSKVKPIIWTKQEINALDISLRDIVLKDVQRRRWAQNRADWYESRDFWLNLEPLTYQPCLKPGNRAFHARCYEMFESTIFLIRMHLRLDGYDK